MKRIVFFLALPLAVLSAQSDHAGAGDQVTTITRQAGQGGPALQFGEYASDHGVLGHPYVLIGRHPKPGCFDTAKCGEIFYEYHGWNLRTSAGTTWQSQLMGDTSTPSVNAQCNYIALTNTAVTPAEADTTLSGEIVSNGLSRAQATYADSSGTLTVPSAPTATPQGSAGSTTYYYWVMSANQGIYTTLSSSGTTATANATLTLGNSVQVSWPAVSGASAYYVFRTTTNSAPTGATTTVGGADGTSQANCTGAGESGTCYINDIANTLAGTSITIPGSNLTNYGKFTLIHTWTATASQSAQAFGVLTASSSGTMCFEGTFTSVSLNNGDTFQLTETVLF